MSIDRQPPADTSSARSSSRATLARGLGVVLGVAAVSQLAVGTWLYGRLRERLESDLGRRLQQVAALIAQGLDAPLLAQFRAGDERLAAYGLLRARLAGQAAAAGVARAWVADRDLRTLVDSSAAAAPGTARHALLAQRSEAQAALAGRAQATRLWRDERGELRLSALVPLRARDGRILGLVGVEAPPDFFVALALLRREMLLLGAIGLVLSTLAGALVLRRVGARLEGLRRAAAQAARGDLAARPEVAGDDAIGALGRDLDGLIAAGLARRALYESVLADLDVGLLAADAEGRVRLANAALRRLLELPAGDVAGRLLDEILGEQAELRRLAAEVGATGVTRAARVAQRGGPAAGGRALAVSVAPLHEPGGRVGLVVSLLDVTALEELERRARGNERLAGLGGMAGGLLHEVGNPRAAVSLYLDLLRPLVPAGEAGELCERALRESVRVHELLEDFRVFAGLRPLRLERAELRALAEASRADLGWPAGVELQVIGGAAEARCDPRLMTHALRNLLRNAAEALLGRTGRVELHVACAQGEARVSVRDDGPGLSAADAERAREPLFTTKPHGSGLGLAIVERVVEAHGGRLQIERPVGGGALFTLRWPAGE